MLTFSAAKVANSSYTTKRFITSWMNECVSLMNRDTFADRGQNHLPAGNISQRLKSTF